MKVSSKNSFQKPLKPAPKKKKKIKMPKSSSSNPTTKKFREAARRKHMGGHFPQQKSTFSAPNQGTLTLKALEKHNEVTGGFTEASLQDDATSFGGTTFNTWATNMTGCTNATFSRVHRYINSNSSVQKEILAVLAAVTEVIKEKGGEGKDLQYFAVLVSSLQEADKAETKMAMAHLLSIVIKRVNVAVLQNKFTQVVKTLLDVITVSAKESTLSPIKPAISCMASLLRVQQLSTWMESSTEHAFRALLAFILHKKPKLRKAAQIAVRVVLRGSLLMQETPAPPFHPAAPITAQYCLKHIESSGGLSNKVEVLHILSLLKDTLNLFPSNNVKSLCEVVLRLMTLTDLIVRSSCMEVLHKLFAAKPSDKTMSGEMNAQIITALYDYQPSEKDSQPMQAWLRVMESAVINLAGRVTACRISKFNLLRQGHNASCSCGPRPDSMPLMLVKLLEECVEPYKEKLTHGQNSNQSLTSIQKVLKCLETGLSYQFHAVWELVLQLWSTAFLVFGKLVPKMLTKCLVSMGDLRDTPHFSFKSEMDKAIGSAVKSMGPRQVLNAIPLDITGENDDPEFPRGWLLPVIRDNVTHTELGFFTSYFLPLAAKLKKTAEECADKSIAQSKAYDALQLQIWSMLRGFCDHPTDVKQSFQGIAKTLGTALNERDDLRMDVLAALRSLISCSMDNDADKAEVGRFAKNFLPILFNQYTSDGQTDIGTRLAVLETTKKYFQVTSKELLIGFIERALGKIAEKGIGVFRSASLMDLTIALIPYADEKHLKQIFQLSLSQLQISDKTIQKKSYRILEEICTGQTPECVSLLTSGLDEISKTLLSSLSKSSPSSKAPRLRCLKHIYANLEEENENFLTATLPEAILCTKEIGVKARSAAFELVVAMSETYIKWNADVEEKESLGDFVNKVLAGLAGSPHMISATLLALTRLVYHYKDRLTGAVLDNLIESVHLLLTVKTREIIKTALGFIKVLLSAYDNTVLAAHLKDMLNSLHEIAEKGNMRRLTKIIYVKLIKKFGYELILSMTQASIHKLLKSIYKSNERAKKKKEKENEVDDEDDDSDDEDTAKAEPERQLNLNKIVLDLFEWRDQFSIEDLLRDTDSELDDDDDDDGNRNKGKKVYKKKEKQAYLMETGEDEIVDFMDPAASKQILATKPKEDKKDNRAGEKDRGFKMAADGRLIITQDVEEEEKKNRKSSGKAAESGDEEDDLEDLFAALEGVGAKKKSKKRKRDESAPGDDDYNEEETGASASKYKAGGSGIHRPIAQAKRSGPKSESDFGQEYRSKKAPGDVKKKDKPDPFAYVPLNFNALNKRKQMKNRGSFKNLVKGAQKGAAKGLKSKAKKGKR
ncbi:ribosomal RNA processing 12 homolog [Elysia marginata]|uniref:Ribosomal RNA processing 12 homolog n=1 Tax=Elysia marginata TaxID=1093978 RepID=A0AAV4F6D2_9GAST|nr:ribosomal RNA processing 12 homolog [Elysia marginata]